MIKVNLIPDIITFNQIIKALCEMRLVDVHDYSCGYLAEIRYETECDHVHHASSRLVQCRRHEDGVQDSQSMIEIGYEPDVWTWNVILHGLCQQNAMDDAMHL